METWDNVVRWITKRLTKYKIKRDWTGEWLIWEAINRRPQQKVTRSTIEHNTLSLSLTSDRGPLYAIMCSEYYWLFENVYLVYSFTLTNFSTTIDKRKGLLNLSVSNVFDDFMLLLDMGINLDLGSTTESLINMSKQTIYIYFPEGQGLIPLCLHYVLFQEREYYEYKIYLFFLVFIYLIVCHTVHN